MAHRPVSPKFIIYTAARRAGKKQTGRIAAILVRRQSANIVEFLASPAPPQLGRLFRDPNSLPIYGPGIAALVAATAVWHRILARAQVSAYFDNDPSSNGMVRGDARLPVARNMILRFWKLISRRPNRVWFGRVHPLDLADLSTRNRPLLFMTSRPRECADAKSPAPHFTSKWHFFDRSLGRFLESGQIRLLI